MSENEKPGYPEDKTPPLGPKKIIPETEKQVTGEDLEKIAANLFEEKIVSKLEPEERKIFSETEQEASRNNLIFSEKPAGAEAYVNAPQKIDENKTPDLRPSRKKNVEPGVDTAATSQTQINRAEVSLASSISEEERLKKETVEKFHRELFLKSHLPESFGLKNEVSPNTAAAILRRSNAKKEAQRKKEFRKDLKEDFETTPTSINSTVKAKQNRAVNIERRGAGTNFGFTLEKYLGENIPDSKKRRKFLGKKEKELTTKLLDLNTSIIEARRVLKRHYQPASLTTTFLDPRSFETSLQEQREINEDSLRAQGASLARNYSLERTLPLNIQLEDFEKIREVVTKENLAKPEGKKALEEGVAVLIQERKILGESELELAEAVRLGLLIEEMLADNFSSRAESFLSLAENLCLASDKETGEPNETTLKIRELTTRNPEGFKAYEILLLLSDLALQIEELKEIKTTAENERKTTELTKSLENFRELNKSPKFQNTWRKINSLLMKEASSEEKLQEFREAKKTLEEIYYQGDEESAKQLKDTLEKLKAADPWLPLLENLDALEECLKRNNITKSLLTVKQVIENPEANENSRQLIQILGKELEKINEEAAKNAEENITKLRQGELVPITKKLWDIHRRAFKTANKISSRLLSLIHLHEIYYLILQEVKKTKNELP